MPEMEDHADRIENAADYEKRRRSAGQLGDDGIESDQAAPAKRQVKADREAVEIARAAQLQDDAGECDRPDGGEEADRDQRLLELDEKGRVGTGDQQEDRGMIEAAQDPFGGRDGP